MDFSNLEIGTCKYCKKQQSSIGKDGFWIMMSIHINQINKPDWICYKCKNEHKIYSYPVACEWCKYENVQWFQGHTYNCPRCAILGIKHYGFEQDKNHISR
jgi:hypothetical protein